MNSHKKALAAISAGRFTSQIIPVPIPQKKGDPKIFSKDESPRPETTMEALGKLKPAFKKDGTVISIYAAGSGSSSPSEDTDFKISSGTSFFMNTIPSGGRTSDTE